MRLKVALEWMKLLRMRLVIVLAAVATVIGGCDYRATPAQAYRNWDDRLIVAVRLDWLRQPCVRGERLLPTDRCYRMDLPKRWRGLWRNEFEGSRFCPAPATDCTHATAGEDMWLGTWPVPPEGLYAVDFVGRRTAVKGHYGHMGMSEHEIVVDRMLSMKKVGGPAPPVVPLPEDEMTE